LEFGAQGCLCTAVFTVQGKDVDRIERELKRIRQQIESELGTDLLGEGDVSLQEVVGRSLIKRSVRLAVAESCTGGLITSMLVDVPGISSVLDRGVVTYSNSAKTALLGVSEDLLKVHGAVSRVTALGMAEGIRVHSGTDIGLAVTGIAGPSGGSPGKPVGTVFVALSTPDGNEVTEYHFRGDRSAVRLQSAQMALDRLRRVLLKTDRAV